MLRRYSHTTQLGVDTEAPQELHAGTIGDVHLRKPGRVRIAFDKNAVDAVPGQHAGEDEAGRSRANNKDWGVECLCHGVGTPVAAEPLARTLRLRLIVVNIYVDVVSDIICQVGSK